MQVLLPDSHVQRAIGVDRSVDAARPEPPSSKSVAYQITDRMTLPTVVARSPRTPRLLQRRP